MSSRIPTDLGPATNGMTLPDPSQISYPLKVEHVHVRAGDYVTADTFVYVVIDRDGTTFGFKADQPGQVTRVMVAEGEIFTEQKRLFELCCDDQAQIFAKEHAVETSFVTGAGPAGHKKEPSRNVAEPHTRPESETSHLVDKKRSGGRLQLIGTLAGIAIVTGAILMANGAFDGVYEKFSVWRDPGNYGYASYQEYLDRKSQPAPIVDSFFEGEGTWQGREYVGELKNHKPHGTGKIALQNLEEYFGTWVDGVRQSKGHTKTLFSDAMREGSFDDELRLHGQGTQIFENGNRYIGQFHQGKRHGQGTYTFADGTVYDGDYRDNKRHGNGTMRFAGGAIYVGAFVNNARTGQGTYDFENGSRYSGGFLDGLRHGQGAMRFSDGTSYEGEYSKGHRHGSGTLKFANGTIYVGSFVSGLRTGSGRLTFKSGAFYEGNFTNGRINGRGVFRNAVGDVTTGEFNNGLANGSGSIKYANGDSYEGNFKDFRREGMSEFEKAAEVRRKAEQERLAWVARMRQRHEDRKAARRRMARAGNRNAIGQSIERDEHMPGRVYWAIFNTVPQAVGEAIPCRGAPEKTECYVLRKEKIWRLDMGCISSSGHRGNAEARDIERIVVYEGRGDLSKLLPALRDTMIRQRNSNTAQHLRMRMSEGLLTNSLVDDIWNDLADVKIRVNDATAEATGVRDMRKYFRTYTSLATYTLTSGCYVDINGGEGPSEMR